MLKETLRTKEKGLTIRLFSDDDGEEIYTNIDDGFYPNNLAMGEPYSYYINHCNEIEYVDKDLVKYIIEDGLLDEKGYKNLVRYLNDRL